MSRLKGPYTPRRKGCLSMLAAPGPGRDFDGCPKACGQILATVLVFAGVFAAHVVAVLRVIA